MRVLFVVPCFNAGPNLHDLAASFRIQMDSEWRAMLIDDMSTDDTWVRLMALNSEDDRFRPVRFQPGEKRFALRNVVETVASFAADDDIIAVVDGDDQLCNDRTVGLLKDAYQKGAEAVWTAHRWDINNLNISGDLPASVNPYQHPWRTSHLKTFRASVLKGIPQSNFKDHRGEWFQRGYDQALYLPILHHARGEGKRAYIPEVCYLYRINSVSVRDRDWAERAQLSTVNLVRARGYLSE